MPTHIFLVHGEEEAQDVLKEKIIETTQIPVTIPEYGESYTLGENISVSSQEYSNNQRKRLRKEVLERLHLLKDEIEDMTEIVKQDLYDEATEDMQVIQMREKIGQLERQIAAIIEE